MKLPPMTATRTVRPAVESLQLAAIGDLAAGITSLGSAVVSKIPCLALNCGASVLSCIYCGTNPVCWLTCAGPGAVQCVSQCLAG